MENEDWYDIWGCRHCGNAYEGTLIKGQNDKCYHCGLLQSKSYEEQVGGNELSRKVMNREKDVEIAIEKYGWHWENAHGIRNILVPPKGDDREFMTARWDENGVPHFLPKYSEGDS